MAARKTQGTKMSLVRKTVEKPREEGVTASKPIVKTNIAKRCEECRVDNAFHAWRDQHLTPSYNWMINFAGTVNIPAGKRAVIELVTATISVPSGEKARLRMYTSLGSNPSNLDFVLTPQGRVGGKEIFVATHSVRVYSDNHIEFNVNRDNDQTEGDAFICISGYLIDV